MKLRLTSAKMFRECLDAITSLVDEAEFVFDDEGMKLRAMDPSQIAMVDFVLPKAAFEVFEPSKEKIGLNIDDLSTFVKRARTDDALELSLDETGSRLVVILQGKSTRRFYLPLLDVATVSPPEPKIPFDARIKINGGTVKESFKDASLVSSCITLRVTEDAFIMEAKGDKGQYINEIPKDSEIIFEHFLNAEARAMYPLEYLIDVTKPADKDVIMTLEFKTDAPLRLSYPVGEANVAYYLAPRMEA